MEAFFKLAFLVLLIAFLVCIGPWLYIWSINTLVSAAMVGAPAGAFVPQIAFGFWTWLAAALLGGLGFAIFRSK